MNTITQTPNLMQSLPGAYDALTLYKQFILYVLVPSKTRPGKVDKLPVDFQTGKVADANDPAIWADYETAAMAATTYGDDYGVGFVFTVNDPFFFVDIDECSQSDGTWSPIANDVLARLPGAAVEISQSGRGLHIIGQGIAPDHACKNTTLHLEYYTDSRFVALTGTNAIGSAATDCSAMLPAMTAELFPPKTATKDQTWTTAPVPEWNGTEDNDELLAKSRATKSASATFGNAASFEDLWVADQDALAAAYPPDSSDSGNHDESSADAALTQHLAFWTGNNCERILNLMWCSKLVREKWNRPDYLIRTITRAVSMQEVVYTGGKKPERPRIPVEPPKQPLGNMAGPEILTGYQFLGATQQIEHFKGCVYIQDQHRVFTPNGSLLRSEQFNATYGGYSFMAADDGKITRKAWEAFTESQAVRYPKAESICFRPEIAPGTLVEQEGRVLVNVYVPAQGERVQGDVSPFLEHIERLLPDDQDREIFLSYIAACVQRPGVKFQWCVLLQGAEGNGKTFFYYVLAYALGERYAHLPNAAEITNPFNAWIEQKLIIGIEELHTAGRQEVADTLKPWITNKRIEIHGKGQDQRTGDNRANFIMFSNHKDAVLKTENDRRYCVLYTAQQEPGDIERDGMNSGYFAALYRWLERGGFAHVAEYLSTRPVNVDVMARAPVTSSTAEAVRTSLGVAEQMVHEAIELEEFGFRGDLICTKAAADLLRAHGKKLSPQKTVGVLLNLGFIRHPALEASRGTVKVDGILRRLYVKRASLTSRLTTPKTVADAFRKAQIGTVAIDGLVQAGSMFSQPPKRL